MFTYNIVQASNNGNQTRGARARLRALMVFGLITGLLLAATPRAAHAASPHIATSTYGRFCDKWGCLPFLRIKGVHFTPHGRVIVAVQSLYDLSTIFSVQVNASAQGTFDVVTNIEINADVCNGGVVSCTPFIVQAYDVSSLHFSDIAMGIGDSWGDGIPPLFP